MFYWLLNWCSLPKINGSPPTTIPKIVFNFRSTHQLREGRRGYLKYYPPPNSSSICFMVGYLFTKAWNSVGVLYTCILKSCFRFFFWLWGHRQSPHPRPWSIDRQKGLLCSPLTKCLSSCQEIHLFLPRDTTHVLLGFRCAFIVGVIFFLLSRRSFSSTTFLHDDVAVLLNEHK